MRSCSSKSPGAWIGPPPSGRWRKQATRAGSSSRLPTPARNSASRPPAGTFRSSSGTSLNTLVPSVPTGGLLEGCNRRLLFHRLDQPLPHVSNMGAHGLLRFVAVAVFERLQNGIVVVRGGAARKVIAGAAREPDLILNILQDGAEVTVVSRLSELRMKQDVLLNVVRLVIRLQQRALPFETLS